MKRKIFFFLLVLFTLFSSLHAKITGYLSLDYTKGQREFALSHGTFQNSQAGLLFSGDVTPTLSYLTEIRFNAESEVELEQAWISLGSSEAFNLKLGLYLVPFGRYNPFNRPHQTMLIHSPLNVEKVYPLFWRDIGIQVQGRWRGFFYSAYLGNGLSEDEELSRGQQFKDNNRDKGKGGRVGLALSQRFEIAYSYYNGKYDAANERGLTLQGADLFWIEEGYQIYAEYTRARLEIPDGTGKVDGFFVQAIMDMGRLRPVACYQLLDYEDGFHGLGFLSPDIPGAGISEKKRRWALGFMYQASENLVLKFEYDFNSEKDADLKDDSFSVQAALSF
jgi:hypothetical protein